MSLRLLLLTWITYLLLGNGVAGVICFMTFRQTIECRFTLKLVRDLIITYSQMHRTDKYSKHNTIIWPVWLNV